MDTDFNCVFEGLGAVGALYISNAKTANNLAVLQSILFFIFTRTKHQGCCYCCKRKKNRISSNINTEIHVFIDWRPWEIPDRKIFRRDLWFYRLGKKVF
jgi:hypothetical protein